MTLNIIFSVLPIFYYILANHVYHIILKPWSPTTNIRVLGTCHVSAEEICKSTTYDRFTFFFMWRMTIVEWCSLIAQDSYACELSSCLPKVRGLWHEGWAITLCSRFNMSNLFMHKSERGDYCIWTYLSSLQHKTLTPFRFVADSSQMTWTRLIWGLQNEFWCWIS